MVRAYNNKNKINIVVVDTKIKPRHIASHSTLCKIKSNQEDGEKIVTFEASRSHLKKEKKETEDEEAKRKSILNELHQVVMCSIHRSIHL